ncbi:MAG: GlsB/YeaQ/YmgE family stress response membrane protein [Saprospiraceae bacterium]|nr:MAG: transglycosylase-associated protein [Bacteroidetes bacterium OLB9]MCO6464203.1 GlsB/YeaQ/YmgE family stress response membrane protein [Saprospiraceae bacterium]MCZ2338486.1 GlsB/YeaQ/YmgE family stress response membrane protein [Chitinophagales bacterium]
MDWSIGTFDWSLLATIFFGALSGYVASRILGGEGFGLLGNIVVGVIGGYLGSWIVRVAKIPLMPGFFGTLISSVGGAIILLFFIELIKSMQRTNSSRRKR